MSFPLLRSGPASILSALLTIGTEILSIFTDIPAIVPQVLPILLELSGTSPVPFILPRLLPVLTNGPFVQLRILPVASTISIVLVEVAAYPAMVFTEPLPVLSHLASIMSPIQAVVAELFLWENRLGKDGFATERCQHKAHR